MTLKPYEDRDVVQSTIRVVNAGDGLSDALAIDPVEYHVGDKVHVVVETDVVKVTYEPIKNTGVLRRVHTLRAGFGTIVHESAVTTMLEEHRVALEKARGVERLPIGDGDDS